MRRLFLVAVPLVLTSCEPGGSSGNAAKPGERVSVTELRQEHSAVGRGAAPGALTADPHRDCTLDTATSALWREFVDARQTGTEPVLPDFSYAGYRYSDEPVPAVPPGPRFDVVEFGAIPDDGLPDGMAIQAAIDAAEAAGGGTVVFPAGRFRVSESEHPDDALLVTASGVVLKGSGSEPGGTEILMDHMKADGEAFVLTFRGHARDRVTLATVVADAPRESFWIAVDDASALEPGQRVVLHYYDPAYTPIYFAPLTVPEEWARLHGNGFRVHEIHQVAEVRGDSVRFREPLHLTLQMHEGADFALVPYGFIEEVGVEDLTIAGRWNEYPEEFSHHEDDIHDYGWNGLRFDRVANGWIRRVRFRDLNQGLLLHASTAVTVDTVRFTGKRGHASIHSRLGYGVLVRDVVDEAGQYHGPGVGYSAAGTVYLRYRMQDEQQVDSHSGSPYATLFDNIDGGVLSGNGGPYVSYPHHARYLVFWNFRHGGGRASYDFWDVHRRQNATFALPIFAGFTANGSVRFEDEERKVLANESPGVRVSPPSLFEAQLRLRQCSR